MLIKASDVIGLKVLTITQGENIQDVNDIVYDPKENRVLALLVDNKGWFKDAKVILFEDINSIGKDNVMVEDASVLQSAGDVEENIAEIARSNNYLAGTKIVTVDGNELGSVTDIYFDSNTGEVDEFVVSQGVVKDVQSGRKRVKISDIITVGKDATIVRSYTEDMFDAQAEEGGVQGAVNQVKDKAQNTAHDLKERTEGFVNDPKTQNTLQDVKDKASNIFNQAADKVREFDDKVKAKVSETKEDISGKVNETREDVEARTNQAKQDIEFQQEKNVSGQILTKDIFSMIDGSQLAKVGDTITPDLLQRAEEHKVKDQVVMNARMP
jgi:uncharacterized protein YrrD